MISIKEALAAMMPGFSPVGTERVALMDAVGRFLATDILGRSDLPAFSNSAMDGYAMRAEDVASATEDTPVGLPVVAVIKAGDSAPPALKAGQAMRIFTGAMVPEGADAVVMQENTDGGDVKVAIKVAPKSGQNIRFKGSDLRAGGVMLPANLRVSAGELGLLSAQRIGSVVVYRKPLVAILSTGDELRDITDPVEPGTIVNSNAYALAAQVQEAGGIPWVLPNVADTLEATVASLQEALRADLVISCGGVSVGDYDFVKPAFEAVGIKADFWKVAVKPGKPLTFGLCNKTPVVGLPGNPISAMVTFEAFVRPGLRQMIGDPKPYRPAHNVTLTHTHRHSPGRPELARATVQRTDAGLEATMLRLQGSGSLPSMIGVDALVMLPKGTREFPEGEKLKAILLHDQQGDAQSPF